MSGIILISAFIAHTLADIFIVSQADVAQEAPTGTGWAFDTSISVRGSEFTRSRHVVTVLIIDLTSRDRTEDLRWPTVAPKMSEVLAAHTPGRR